MVISYLYICISNYFHGLLVAVLLTLITTQVVASEISIKSHYTSVKAEDCWRAKGDAGSRLNAGKGDYAVECMAPKGWRLFILSDSERSWIEIARGYKIWSTEYEVTSNNSFGYFQDLGGLEQVEWRLKPDGTPVSLIFRVTAQDPNAGVSGGNLSRLYIIGLTGGIPKFCGVVKTNEEARRKGDFPQNCTELPEQP